MLDKDARDTSGTSGIEGDPKSTIVSSSSTPATKALTPHEKEVKFLKSQVAGLEILLQQNALLESEVTRLHKELDTATQSIIKRGFLYKWRDREIGWASKWGLRYFSLQGMCTGTVYMFSPQVFCSCAVSVSRVNIRH